MNKTTTRPVILASALVVLLSLALGSLNIIIVALSIGIFHSLFSDRIDKTIFDSKLFAFILIIFSYIILLQCTVLISWSINHNFPLDQVPLLSLAILSMMCAYNHLLHREHPKTQQKETGQKIINTQDTLSLIVATVIAAIILVPPISLKPEYIKPTLVMSLISGNVDDTSHLSLINDDLQFNRGIPSRSDASGLTRKGGFYPAGWHSVNTIFIKMFYPSIKTGSSSLIAYGIQKLFWFIILLYLLTRVSFTVFRFIGSNSLKTSSLFWISSSALYLNYTFLLPIFKEGFYSFLPQLIAALLAVPVIIQLSKEKANPPYRSLPFLFIICIGGCLSWLLPLPPFFFAVLFIALCLIIDKRISTMLQNILNILIENAALLVILALAVIIQILAMVSTHDDSAMTFLAGILMGGGITTYDKYFYIFIYTGFIASLILAKTAAKKNVHFVLFLIASLLLYCTYIYWLQISHLGKNEYFYFKVLDILTITIIPFCITGFGLIIKKIAGNSNLITATTISTIILAVLVQLIGLDSSTLSFARGYRAFSSPIDNSIISELENHLSQDNYFNKNYSFYYIPNSNYYFQNEVAAMMAKTNAPDSTCFVSIRHSIWKTPPINQLLDDIYHNCQGYNINLITDKANSIAFSSAVNSKGLRDIVNIKYY